MSLRSTFIALFLIIGLCAAMLYGVSSYFGRGADMRNAELAFQEKHGKPGISAGRAVESGTRFRKTKKAEPVSPPATADTGSNPDGWYAATGIPGEGDDLSSWYAEAGSLDGPVDPQPEENSFLINDTQPLVSTDPL